MMTAANRNWGARAPYKSRSPIRPRNGVRPRPRWAESFSDQKSDAGTVYKATNGLTKGYSQDRHRNRKPNAALNLAVTRNVLVALIPFEPCQSLAHFLERRHRHPPHALRLILKARPVL